MTIAPHRVLRYVGFAFSYMVDILLQRGVPVQAKAFALKKLRVLVPYLILKHPNVIEPGHIAILSKELGIDPPNTGLGKPENEVIRWYLDQLKPREGESLLDYYDRVGTVTLIILSNYMLSTYGSGMGVEEWMEIP